MLQQPSRTVSLSASFARQSFLHISPRLLSSCANRAFFINAIESHTGTVWFLAHEGKSCRLFSSVAKPRKARALFQPNGGRGGISAERYANGFHRGDGIGKHSSKGKIVTHHVGGQDASEKPVNATTKNVSWWTSSAEEPRAPPRVQCQTHMIKGGLPCDPAPPPFQLAMWGEQSLYTLVLLRHGESEWNNRKLFTGWCDVNLTKRGEMEARDAGRILNENGIEIDHAFTSVLKRASFTTNMALNTAQQHWVPVTKTWRLNERSYGALQGYNKDTAYRELDMDQELVMEMRRSYHTAPPKMGDDHARWHGKDRRYKSLSSEQINRTRGESLKDTADRILPFYESVIIPSLQAGNKCLVVSHANTLRTLIKHIDGITDEDIKGMSIPTGIPLLYRLDKDLKPVDPKNQLEFRYLVEPKGYTWATSTKYGFHGVYLGDLKRLQDIQKQRDASNRDWQRMILRNLARCIQSENPSALGSSFGGSLGNKTRHAVMETRQLWWQIQHKMSSKAEYEKMMILSRMKNHLEDLMLHRRQKYMTMSAFENILNLIHLDTEGKVVEPFEELGAEIDDEERARKRYEMLALELEEECLIK